ncbi:MAG: sugar phosphate isomerase/epimerase family protein [Phycisphaerae bacterium]
MRIGVCTGIEKLKSAPPGLDYVEAAVEDLLCPRQGDDAFQKRLALAKACPVPVEAVNLLIPGDMKTTGPCVDIAALDAYMATVLRRAALAGVRMVGFGCGGSRRVPEGFDRAKAQSQIAGHLRRWGPLATACNLTIAVEPLNKAECNIINTVAEAAEMARSASYSCVKALVDTYHAAKDGDPPDSIRRSGGMICHAHCAEGDGRGPLGTKGEDHRPYFKALKEIGYDGRISIEARWTDFEQQVGPAVAELRRQWETA